MGSKIKNFFLRLFDRLFRNSNDEIDVLNDRLNDEVDILLNRIEALRSQVSSQIDENYHAYLGDNKKLRDEVFLELATLKDALEKQGKTNIATLRLFAEIVTNPSGHLSDKKKELDRIL